jgi:hypothetical protein
MSNTTVGQCIDMAERKILDESNDEYSEQDLLDLFHLAVKEIINLVPRAHTDTKIWKMAPLSRQVIPSDGVELVDAVMNMGTDGASPGAALRETTLDIMRVLLPGWEAMTATDTIDHFMRLPESKNEFMVFPPNTGLGYLMGRVTSIPAAVLWDSNDDFKLAIIPLDDTFATAIINGMVYMAYDDDSDSPGNTPRSQVYYARFLQDLGLRQQKEVKYKRA